MAPDGAEVERLHHVLHAVGLNIGKGVAFLATNEDVNAGVGLVQTGGVCCANKSRVYR
jgi:hypothetical protein